jgi:hypothetical protein
MSTSFKREYKIIIPKNDNSGEYIPMESKQEFISDITNHFGGVTIIPNTAGCYASQNNNKVQCEENTIIYATRLFKSSNEIMNAKQVEEDRNYLKDISKKIGKEYGQESIFTSDMRCNANLTECEWKPKWSGKMPNIDILPLLKRIGI